MLQSHLSSRGISAEFHLTGDEIRLSIRIPGQMIQHARLDAITVTFILAVLALEGDRLVVVNRLKERARERNQFLPKLHRPRTHRGRLSKGNEQNIDVIL